MKVSDKSCFLKNKTCIILGGLTILIQFSLWSILDKTDWIEFIYSRKVYRYIQYFNKILFGWIPFSIGDLFYCFIILIIAICLCSSIVLLLKKSYRLAVNRILNLFTLILFLYTFFYLNWGLNYYRHPLSTSMHLRVDTLSTDDYLFVLEKYILKANVLRDSIDFIEADKKYVSHDIQQLMIADTLFNDVLSKNNVKIKQPISSALVSNFLVSGYFNPFTSEVQVNQNIPLVSYPFVNVHELAHQMGIGFEDECDFIAFRKLIDHPNKWYRYSAYYNAIKSLLESIKDNQQVFEYYISILSPKIKKDIQQESAFWASHQGRINRLSNLFYSGYLKHNNQPEGLARYSMMSRLIVAWEKQQQ